MLNEVYTISGHKEMSNTEIKDMIRWGCKETALIPSPRCGEVMEIHSAIKAEFHKNGLKKSSLWNRAAFAARTNRKAVYSADINIWHNSPNAVALRCEPQYTVGVTIGKTYAIILAVRMVNTK